MSSFNDAERWRRVKFLFGLALIGAIISLVAFNYQENEAGPAAKRELVFEEFADGLLEKTAQIRINIPDSSFRILKTETGNWVMPERTNFPIDMDKLRRFETDIKYLYKLEHRTSDPSQFDRLGVGEPKEFGAGTTIEFIDKSGKIIAGSSIGQIGNLIFVRKIGAMEVYSTHGQLMDISKRTNWLDFGFLKIPPAAISTVFVQKANGENYRIVRSDNGRFKMSGSQIGSRIDANAGFISRIEPKNVIESERIDRPPLVTQNVQLRDGTIITANLVKQFGSYWIKLKATNDKTNALLPENFGQMAKAWAIEIDEENAENLMLSQEEIGLRGKR